MTTTTRTILRAALAILIVGGQLVAIPSPGGGGAATKEAYSCCCTGECHCTGDCCNHGPATADKDDSGVLSVNPGTQSPAWQGGEHCGVWQNALQTITQTTKPVFVQSKVDVLPPDLVSTNSRRDQPARSSDDAPLWWSSPRAPPLSIVV